jgi:exosome complex RNA-binding protein Csl4
VSGSNDSFVNAAAPGSAFITEGVRFRMNENGEASTTPARGQSVVADVMRERSRRATITSVLDQLARTGGTIEVDQSGWSAQIPDQQADVAR